MKITVFSDVTPCSLVEKYQPCKGTCHIKRVLIIANARVSNLVESSWNVMAHGDAREGSEGETGEWNG